MKNKYLLLAAAFFLSLSQTAIARNEPCSGKKGGVAYCQNGKFVCKDGTISASKKICR